MKQINILRMEWKAYMPLEALEAKRVKVSEIHEELEEHLKLKLSSHSVSQIVKRAFPSSESKAATKSCQKHIFGVQRRILPPHTPPLQGTSVTTSSIATLLKLEQDKKQETA